MTTMRALLTRAIRKTRANPLGHTPPAEEMEAALEDAQAFFTTLTNRALTDVLITADYTAGEDERITDLAGSYTVTYPTEIADSSVDGGERPPRDGAIVEVTGASPTRKIYVSELKTWKTINGLALTDEQPFGPSMDDALSDMLAARFCDSIYQRDASPILLQLAAQGRDAFGARFQAPITAQADPGIRARPPYSYSDWSQS